jgi:hypothetical protein
MVLRDLNIDVDDFIVVQTKIYTWIEITISYVFCINWDVLSIASGILKVSTPMKASTDNEIQKSVCT